MGAGHEEALPHVLCVRASKLARVRNNAVPPQVTPSVGVGEGRARGAGGASGARRASVRQPRRKRRAPLRRKAQRRATARRRRAQPEARDKTFRSAPPPPCCTARYAPLVQRLEDDNGVTAKREEREK